MRNNKYNTFKKKSVQNTPFLFTVILFLTSLVFFGLITKGIVEENSYSLNGNIKELIEKDVRASLSQIQDFKFEKIISTENKEIFIYSISSNNKTIIGHSVYTETLLPFIYKKLQSGNTDYYYNVVKAKSKNDFLVLIYGLKFSDIMDHAKIKINDSIKIEHFDNDKAFLYTYKIENEKTPPTVEVEILDNLNQNINLQLAEEFSKHP